jgi:hypothetical protein
MEYHDYLDVFDEKKAGKKLCLIHNCQHPALSHASQGPGSATGEAKDLNVEYYSPNFTSNTTHTSKSTNVIETHATKSFGNNPKG